MAVRPRLRIRSIAATTSASQPSPALKVNQRPSGPHSRPSPTEWLRRLSAGEIDAPTLVRTHLDQIEASQPRLNAATQILREQALEQARTPRPGPLSGLPITLKETYALAGEQVTIGSARMPPIACAEDAPVVQKLRAAGAIVVARSNVPEFVMNAETNNLRFGRSNNPIDPRRTCGGSSGGEGALVGSGASPLGFGTDILGSIRIPAAFCGVVGFRPHSGAIDKRGVWPVSGPFFESWNGLGPLARSVRDARLAYNVMAEQPLPAPATVAGLRVLQPRGFGLRYATMGLVEFIDWGGGDILYYASRYLREALDSDRYATPEIVERKMADGHTGMDAGKGFYDFEAMDVPAYRKEKMALFVGLLRHFGLLQPPR